MTSEDHQHSELEYSEHQHSELEYLVNYVGNKEFVYVVKSPNISCLGCLELTAKRYSHIDNIKHIDDLKSSLANR